MQTGQTPETREQLVNYAWIDLTDDHRRQPHSCSQSVNQFSFNHDLQCFTASLVQPHMALQWFAVRLVIERSLFRLPTGTVGDAIKSTRSTQPSIPPG